MSYPFVERTILHSGDPTQVASPVKITREPGGGDWNRGVEAYKEQFGKESWDRLAASDFPRPMTNRAGSRGCPAPPITFSVA